MNIKKVIVTGGFGFIGKTLINELLAKNVDVIVIEHPTIKKPRELKNIEVAYCDITNISDTFTLSWNTNNLRPENIPEEKIKTFLEKSIAVQIDEIQ